MGSIVRARWVIIGSGDPVAAAEIRQERLGYVDPTVCPVVGLHDRRPNSGHGQRRTVHRVDRRSAATTWSIPDVAASGLIVTEPRYGRDLEPLIRAWRIDLEVEGPVVALPEVSGADVETDFDMPKLDGSDRLL